MLTRPIGTRFPMVHPILLALFILFIASTASIASQRETPANTVSQNLAELPPPTGRYPIGTVLYDWTDDSREEQWSSAPEKGRELMVQIWYPANSTQGHQYEPYVPDFDRLKNSLKQDWPKLPSFIPSLKTHAILGASLSQAQERYPLLIFSHGMNSARFFYTALLEELASHGYIVAAVDHTYWGPGVAFPSGRIAPYEDGMDARDKVTSDEYDEMMWAGVSVMVADQVFVERKIAELDTDPSVPNPFRYRLDLSRVGSVGHSMGGQAATRACLEYAVFKVCACLDGFNPFFYLRPKPSRKPFLLLINSTWGTSIISQSLAKRYLAAWMAPEVFVIRGTKHNSFDDVPLLDPEARAKAPSDPVKAHAVIGAIVVEFFNRSFGYGEATPLSADELQNMVPVDLKQIASRGQIH
jgi:pimeloyl-ACP methyl ester carboxylesterase